MSLFAKVGSFAQPGSTGNQAITGVGFQPKIVIFWMSSLTADGSGADETLSIGAATSSSDRRWSGDYSKDAGTNNNTVGGWQDDAHCIGIINVTAPTTVNKLAVADFVSMDADGFTVNWTTADATARIVNYLALGGASLTNVKTGQVAENTSTGNQAVTGVGFKPDCLFVWNMCIDNVVPPSGQNIVGRPFMGFVDSALNEGVTAWLPNQKNSPSADKRYQRTSKMVAHFDNNPGNIVFEAAIVSLDSDGFTFNISTATTANYIFYVALKGISVKTGSFNQATATGNQAVTGLGFKPGALLLQSFDNVAATTAQAQARTSIGVTDGINRFAYWQGGIDAQASPFIEKQNLDRANLLKMLTAASTPTVQTVADIVSLDLDGFTINNTTADATAREVLYLALGPHSIIPQIMHQRRQRTV